MSKQGRNFRCERRGFSALGTVRVDITFGISRSGYVFNESIAIVIGKVPHRNSPTLS